MENLELIVQRIRMKFNHFVMIISSCNLAYQKGIMSFSPRSGDTPYLPQRAAHTCPPTPLRCGDNPGTARSLTPSRQGQVQGKCNGGRCQGVSLCSG
jgi:hypothetical protein